MRSASRPGLVETISILAIAAGLCLLLASYLSMGPIWAMDQGAKLVQIESVIHHRFAGTEIVRPGASIDPPGEFSPVPALFTVQAGGRYISRFSYPFAFLCAGLVGLVGTWGLFLPSLGAALGILVLSVRLGRLIGVRNAGLLPWIIIAASPVLFYSLVLWEHQLAALAATFCLVLGAEAEERRQVFWAGCVAGLAFLVRPEALLFGLAICVGVTFAGRDRRRSATYAFSGWILGLVPAVLSNLALYGRPLGADLEMHYRDQMSSWSLFVKEWVERPDVIKGLVFDGNSSVWWCVALVVLGASLNLFAGIRRSLVMLALALASLAFFLSRSGLFHETGLVASCPLLLLLLAPGRPPAAQRPRRFLYLTCGTFFAAVLVSAPDAGSSQWGPRFLLPIIPCLIVLAWRNAEQLLVAARPAGRLVMGMGLGLLLAVSVLLQVHSLAVLKHRVSYWQAVADAAAELGHEIVLTDYWATPLKIAPLYFERQVFLLDGEHELESFRRMLLANDHSRFVFVAAQEWSRDLDRLKTGGVTCSSTADLGYRHRVLDCRVK